MNSIYDLKYDRELDLLLYGGVNPDDYNHHPIINITRFPQDKSQESKKVTRRMALDLKTNKLSIIKVNNEDLDAKLESTQTPK